MQKPYWKSKQITAELMVQAQQTLSQDYQPLDDGRASSAYRLHVAKNCLQRFYVEKSCLKRSLV